MMTVTDLTVNFQGVANKGGGKLIGSESEKCPERAARWCV